MGISVTPVAMCYIEKSPFNASAEERLAAARKLTGAAFKLFIYFDSFVEPKFIYERVDAGKILNLDRTTLNRAFEDLCNEKYLISKGNKIYDFYVTSAENT